MSFLRSGTALLSAALLLGAAQARAGDVPLPQSLPAPDPTLVPGPPPPPPGPPVIGPYLPPPVPGSAPQSPGLKPYYTGPYRVLTPCEAQHPPGCWADFDSDYGCGNLLSEVRFIFGSCRSFWREPCYKGAPPGFYIPNPKDADACGGGSGKGCVGCGHW